MCKEDTMICVLLSFSADLQSLDLDHNTAGTHVQEVWQGVGRPCMTSKCQLEPLERNLNIGLLSRFIYRWLLVFVVCVCVYVQEWILC